MYKRQIKGVEKLDFSNVDPFAEVKEPEHKGRGTVFSPTTPIGLDVDLLGHIGGNELPALPPDDLYENKIPLDPQLISSCEEFKLNVTTLALNGGEDYELLMTISQKDYDKIKGNPNLTVIGYIKEKNAGTNLVLRDNSTVELKSRGWGSKED